MVPEGRSGQTHPCLPVTSSNPVLNDMIKKMTDVLEFIPWQATLVAFDLFLHLALIVQEGFPYLTKRQRSRKITLASGEVVAIETGTILLVQSDSIHYCLHFLSNVGHKCCPHQKTCGILCTLACNLSTLTIACVSVMMR